MPSPLRHATGARADAGVGTATATNLPTSATVLDFICLFTHDLKRKQKRWQDGKLKYHTFNKRIMVYDDRGHFIGDAHWQAENDLEEGEEFELDRGGAIVQVSDCVGHREQDLTELLDKRAKDVERRRANIASRTPASSGVSATIPARREQSTYTQPRHRPLNEIMGTPARIGRASIPTRSPYEARQMAAKDSSQDDGSSRPAKRRKREAYESPPSKSCHARSLFGATLTLSAQPLSSRPMIKRSVLRDRTNLAPTRQNINDTQDSTNEDITPNPSAPSTKTERTSCSTKPDDPSSSLEPRASLLSRAKTAASAVRKSGTRGSVKPDSKESPVNNNREDDHGKDTSTPTFAVVKQVSCKQDQPSCSDGVTTVPPVPAVKVKGHSDDCNVQGQATSTSLSKPALDAQQVTHKDRGMVDIPPREGPRTELRIRSRQKRGLLFLSEKQKPPQLGRIPAQSIPQKLHNEDVQPEKKPPQDKNKECPMPAGTDDGRRQLAQQKPCDEDPKSDGEQSMASSPKDVAKPRASIELESSSESELPQAHSRRSRKMPTRKSDSDYDGSAHDSRPPLRDSASYQETDILSSSDESDSADLALTIQTCGRRGPARKRKNTQQANDHDRVQGPRITKMARKSIKSKEILGFLTPADDVIPTHTKASIDHSWYPTKRDQVSDKASSELHKAEPSKEDIPEHIEETGDTTKPDKTEPRNQFTKPVPRLRNPATRGKKAASKEDAAGLPPQTLIQLDPPKPQRIASITKPSNSTKDAQLPGFSRANGGPWSRHAEDLLGMTRPSEKALR